MQMQIHMLTFMHTHTSQTQTQACTRTQMHAHKPARPWPATERSVSAPPHSGSGSLALAQKNVLTETYTEGCYWGAFISENLGTDRA